MKARHALGPLLFVLLSPPGADAQQVSWVAPSAGVAAAAPTEAFQIEGAFRIIDAAPLEAIPVIRNAPFSADAVTEFTQTLGDGNRIERRYTSSMARDSRGRTRREEELALVGALGATGPAPRLVTIADPEARVSYTLDESTRLAHRNGIAAGKLTHLSTMVDATGAAAVRGIEGRRVVALPPGAVAEAGSVVARLADGTSAVLTESLGTRTLEGVRAEGTRVTSTIPAGAIGNLLPIEVVTERWFSPDLQMAVLITRRDPRAGDSVYRLTNIVRAEQPEALFTVPPGYDVRDGALSGTLKKLEFFRGAPTRVPAPK